MKKTIKIQKALKPLVGNSETTVLVGATEKSLKQILTTKTMTYHLILIVSPN